MTQSYISFIGGKAPLPDPPTLPTNGDVLRYFSFCVTPTFNGPPLMKKVVQTILDTHPNCHSSLSALVRLVFVNFNYSGVMVAIT